jgi:rubrerythrin
MYATQKFLSRVKKPTEEQPHVKEAHRYCPTCAKLLSDRVMSTKKIKRKVQGRFFMTEIACRSMQDVVAFAIEREEKARDFYLSCKEQAKHKGIREFFQEMADEESRHRQLLMEQDLSGEAEFAPAGVEDLKLSDFMVDVRFSPDINYQEALAMAMKKEEKAHAFYSAWKSRCASEKTHTLFDFLAGEELRHKRKLEEIYDSDILQWD